MMREIGSEFWDVPQMEKDNGIFPESAQWFLSGRSALQAIIQERTDCHTVAMPSWCCDSMVKPFVDAGMKVAFYPVCFGTGGLVQEIRLDCDALFLMDYFGYTGPRPDITDYNGVVIRDVTHSLFSYSHSDADYYFGSLRKWCGVWTGGYAWTNDGHKLTEGILGDCQYTAFRAMAMQQKACYINGHGGTDKSYLNLFHKAEEALDEVGIAPAAARDILLARKLDVAYIKDRRRENAEILRSAFPDWLLFPNRNRLDCPMFVPVLVPDGARDALRMHLIQHEIYCPIHWPVSEYHRFDEQTEKIYANELSLVCDQRYTREDMCRIVETIRAFWKER